jgi:hypothetical protein
MPPLPFLKIITVEETEITDWSPLLSLPNLNVVSVGKKFDTAVFPMDLKVHVEKTD